MTFTMVTCYVYLGLLMEPKQDFFLQTQIGNDLIWYLTFLCFIDITFFYSLCYEIVQKVGSNIDPWDVLSNNPMMEFSNFPTNHHLYNNEHHMRPGWFKSEFENRCVLEFVGQLINCWKLMRYYYFFRFKC